MKTKFLICAILPLLFGPNSFAEPIKSSLPEKQKYQIRTVKDWGKMFLALESIENYQERYFGIIKRHDYILFRNMTGEYQKDFEDIDALKREVRKKIGPNNPLLKKLDAIYEKDRLMEQQNPAMTTLDMITRQEKLINDIQRLLNEVYKELKNKLTPQDFELLERSQKRWTKNVDDYISQAFPENENLGSSAPIQKGACTENLTSFRAYLLILILKHVTQGS